MTGAEIKAFTDSLVQDTSAETWFYGALAVAKDALEGERDWEFLKKLDSSQTLASGSTYTTTKALPSDFRSPITLHVGNETNPRAFIGQENLRTLRDQSGSWFIDWVNSTYSFTGTEGTGGTIWNLYKRFTADIAAGTSPSWPAGLATTIGRCLAYDVAKQWFAQDQGEKEFSWSPEMAAEAKRLKDILVLWDERLKAAAANSAGTPADMSNTALIR